MSVDSAIAKLREGIAAQKANIKDFREGFTSSKVSYDLLVRGALFVAEAEGKISAYQDALTSLENGREPERLIHTLMMMHMTRPLKNLSAEQVYFVDGERQGVISAVSYIAESIRESKSL